MIKNPRIIIFAIIIFICTISIGIGIFIQMSENDYKKAIKKSAIVVDENEIESIKNNFKNIFNNDISGSFSNAEKKNEDADIVYTAAERVEIVANKYDLDVQIPRININSYEVEKCNKDIEKIFQDKAIEIMDKAQEYTVYSVKYHAYINGNTLSLIIKSNLKVGEKPEREIIKTYNYNITANQVLAFDDIISYKNFDKSDIQKRIYDEIKSKNEYNKNLIKLGYSVFERNVDDDMYKVENITNFIKGENGYIYIIYAYGNNNYTSETDLVII